MNGTERLGMEQRERKSKGDFPKTDRSLVGLGFETLKKIYEKV